jgi:hypothetical protein
MAETADDINDPTPYLPDSDTTALRTFIRELVAQSIVPNMERAISTWNEQVLARRRGISGRFMSLSKRWTPFGNSSRNSSSSSTGTSSSSNNNYDSLQGFYRPDAPEALMRKLADYCFMLRDYKLALSTYDILRTDFQNDKAWRHYASAAELAALSALLSTSPLTSKTRTENIDAWIDAASYSYTDRQRSAAPYYALRTLTLSLELLRLRGSSAADDAARWAARILDAKLVGPVGAALFTERISACYAVRTGVGALKVGSRGRKAAFWAVLAAQGWWRLGKALQAEKCLDRAMVLYAGQGEGSGRSGRSDKQVGDEVAGLGLLPCEDMRGFVEELRREIMGLRLANRGLRDEQEGGTDDDDEGEGNAEKTQKRRKSVHMDDHGPVEVATESLDKSPRAHRKSLIGVAAPTAISSSSLEVGNDLFEGV